MMTTVVAYCGNVKFPSNKVGSVVEQIKKLSWYEIVTLLCSVGTPAGLAMGAVIYLLGGFAGNTVTSHDVQDLRGQIASLATQVSVLSDRMPRPDQMTAIDRHLSAQDGRMDGLDTRLRGDEDNITRALTRLDEIEASSRVTLLPAHK